MLNLDPFKTLSTLNAVTNVDKISGQLPLNNKRVYYCQRCLNHGRLEPRKNHKCDCIYASCTCQKCILVEKRRVLNTQLHELEETSGIDASEAAPQVTVPPEVLSPPWADEDSHAFDFQLSGHERLKGERVPNCQKCGQHGRKSRLKGHKRVCPFKDCNCPKCQVVSERQKLMADQIKIRRRQRKDTIMNLTREKITATLNAAAAVAAAGPLPYLNNLGLLYNQLNTSASQVVDPLPSPASTVSSAAAAPISIASSLAGSLPEPSPTLPQAFFPTISAASAPTPSYLPTSSAATDFFKPEPVATSQLSQLLLGTSPTAALAALTVGSPPAALPTASATSNYDTGSETSSNPSLSNSPTPSSPPLFETNLPAPIPINPLLNLQSTFPSNQLANITTQEQLLAFLANFQLSSCFPGLNTGLTANEPEGTVTGLQTPTPTENKPSLASVATNFVDICTV